MISDPFYAGAAIDVIYPSQIMSNHPFSEPEWNPSHLVRDLPAIAGAWPSVATVPC